MATTRNAIIKQAQAWIGCKESNGTHKPIIDIYNNDKPLPRGYKVKYTDEWCATFISALGIKCGAKDIILKECSCSKMIELHQANGTWIERDAYVPAPGDLILYDWEDKKPKEENTNRPNHIGIVEKVSGKTITVIEGNYKQSVKRRTLKVNGRYIRGYVVPKYELERVETVNIEMNVLREGSKGEQVRTLQRLLRALGYSVGLSGVDGSFGPATLKALKKYQKANKLEQDGVCGQATWNSLLK